MRTASQNCEIARDWNEGTWWDFFCRHIIRIGPAPRDQSRTMDETSWWDAWNATYHSAQDGPISSELYGEAAAVVNSIAKDGDRSVLEIGCGTGSLSRLLASSSYHGIDISPAAIDIARQKAACLRLPAGRRSPVYEAADWLDWSPPYESFDVAVCIDAIACFRDRESALSRIARSLRPSGRLVLTTLNPFVYRRISRKLASYLQSGPFSHWLSRRELHALLRSAGFAIERSYTIMPAGERGILRIINSRRLNQAFGRNSEALCRRLKERAGLGRYRIVIARKN